MPPAARTSHSPGSHEEEEHAGTGIHSRSRNARAQARHRAKRKAYIENLEANVKRLQAIVDANGLDPAAPPPPAPPHSHAPHPHPYVIHELQAANDRLRREADEMRVQLEALMSAHVAGAHVTPPPPASATATPPPDKKRRMSAERDRPRGSIYLASASVPSTLSFLETAPAALIAPQPPILAPSALDPSFLCRTTPGALRPPRPSQAWPPSPRPASPPRATRASRCSPPRLSPSPSSRPPTTRFST
ncbi:hypothetical protein FRC12_019480 [Ceratobasidium sp. 428]|nr:hypothetical protein FRC12_019480 [Ceratobasidium sp. 428]